MLDMHEDRTACETGASRMTADAQNIATAMCHNHQMVVPHLNKDRAFLVVISNVNPFFCIMSDNEPFASSLLLEAQSMPDPLFAA